jgi:hypothetical protein
MYRIRKQHTKLSYMLEGGVASLECATEKVIKLI